MAATAYTIGSAPETGHDNLAYHLPRLGYWQQQRAVAPFVAGNARAGSFPPDGNVLQLPPVLFLGHDRFCGLVQLGAAVLTAVAVYGIGRGLGATAFASSLAGLCWLAIPCMLEQAARSMVDVTSTFFIAAAAFFVATRRTGLQGPIAALAAVALAVGTKTTTAVVGAPLALLALWRLWRIGGRLVLLAPLLLLPLGGSYAPANRRVWGDPNGLASIRWIVTSPSLASLRKNVELVLWPFLSPWRRAPGRSLLAAGWEACSGFGYGIGWLALGALTGVLLCATLLRGRAPAERRWIAWWALGCGSALVLCLTLRHQDSVLRFLLPAAAVVTPAFAWTFDRVAGSTRARLAVAALVWTGVSLLLWHWEGAERAFRRRDGRWLARSERYGPELEPLALLVGALDLGPRPRLGLLTPDYFPEGIFFGPGYRNRLVPLSYAPPRGRAELDALDLDALWVTTTEACTVVLFRREFARPPARPQRNRHASVDTYDEDFVRAYSESIEHVDLKPTVRGWRSRGPAGAWRSATFAARWW